MVMAVVVVMRVMMFHAAQIHAAGGGRQSNILPAPFARYPKSIVRAAR
jgi:hypothetical protein